MIISETGTQLADVKGRGGVSQYGSFEAGGHAVKFQPQAGCFGPTSPLLLCRNYGFDNTWKTCLQIFISQGVYPFVTLPPGSEYS